VREERKDKGERKDKREKMRERRWREDGKDFHSL
jgi:hypothetical protein